MNAQCGRINLSDELLLNIGEAKIAWSGHHSDSGETQLSFALLVNLLNFLPSF